MEILFREQDQSVLDRLIAGEVDRKEWFDLKTEAERLSLTKGFDRLLSLDDLGLDLYEHQKEAVLRVLREMRGRAVLADEVGLGKTIEAGVILKEYLIRGLVRRVLILVPASLVSQWREELKEKLGLDFRVGRTHRDFASGSKLIASIDRAKRAPYAPVILESKWDMVVVDEAHRLKNQKTLNWRFVNGIQKKYLLLLTATPVQNDLRELYNLITLLKPGQLKTYSQFKRTFMVDKHSPKNTSDLKRALGEVMVRTGRRESMIRFPARRVKSASVVLGADERIVYNSVLEYLRRAYRQMPKEDRNLLPLILVLREVSSHPRAALRSLAAMERRGTLPPMEKGVRERLDGLASALKPTKLTTLVDYVMGLGEPCVVFTEFRLTQKELVRALEESGIAAHAFHGGLSAEQKDRVVRAFREQGGVLVSTEAGGEGRNLQFCRIVVNYDLPWNPMRVEQRIGRVHRLGQKDEVHIFNLVTEGTVDAYVLYLLEKKLDMFHKVIGEVDAILANLDRGFEESLADAALKSPTDEVMREKIEAFGRELERAYRKYDGVRRLNAELFAGV